MPGWEGESRWEKERDEREVACVIVCELLRTERDRGQEQRRTICFEREDSDSPASASILANSCHMHTSSASTAANLGIRASDRISGVRWGAPHH